MNDNKVEKKEMEIDVQRLMGAVWKKAWLVSLTAVVCATLALLVTIYFITPQYESSAKFYVNNNAMSGGDTNDRIESGDISASKSLVNSYIVILQTQETLNAVIEHTGLNRTCAELQKMIAADAVNSTEIFEVVVTSPDPKEAQLIANAIADILPKRISGIIEGTSAKVVDTAVMATKPSSPSYMLNTMVGFVVGLALCMGAIMLRAFFDVTIRSEEDIAYINKTPILATVPDMMSSSKGAYYSSNKKKEENKGMNGSKQMPLVGAEISFAATEAYKLLRTKLQFSFTDEKDSRVIGISSALAGEGKSLSSINLAHALSQLEKRVLLIDCDMRKPSIATKLPLAKEPGLSDYLSGQVGLDTLFQPCGISGEENAFDVIVAGRNPPNPVELLSSPRMAKMLDTLRESYDYIVLDFPPVGEVSDALAVAKITDGMLLVVRQNYGNRIDYANAVRQFEFIEAKLLGIVYNCVTERSNAYGRKYYYYSRYSRSYASSRVKKSAENANQTGANV